MRLGNVGERPIVEPPEGLVVWRNGNEVWRWRIETTGRTISGSSKKFASAVEDALKVAEAHGFGTFRPDP